MRYLALCLVAISLVSCSRDPNVLKQKYVQSGNKYFDAGRYKEASIMYRKSIEADRKFGPAYYHLALTDLKLGSVASAVGPLRRAHELLQPGTPERDDTDLKLSEIIILGSQSQENSLGSNVLLEEVQDMVDGFIKRNPDSWEGHKLTGDLLMLQTLKLSRSNHPDAAKAQVELALGEYRKALAVKPDNPVIALALGRTLALSGRAAEAETLFKSLLAKDKTNLNGYMELYRLYLGQRKLPEAEAILQLAIRNNPKDPALRLTLAQFYFQTNNRERLVAELSAMDADLKQFPNAYFQAGDFFSRVNTPDQAIRQYEEGIRKDPSRKTAYLKGEIEAYVRAGKIAEAYKLNDSILRNDPKDPEARGLKATFLLDRAGSAADVNKAMIDLQSVVTAKPNNFIYRFNLGRAHFARGEYPQAQQEFDAALQIRPDYIPARLGRAEVDVIRGDNEGALRNADLILGSSPYSVQGIILKSAALQNLKRTDEARALLEAILVRNPKQVDILLQMAMLNLNQKKFPEAEDFFRRAWQADPSNLRGLMGEAHVYTLQNHPEKAVQLVEAESDKYPARLDLKNALGDTYENTGQLDKAIATYQELLPKISDRPQQSNLWNRIGQAWLRKGDYPQSIDALEKARQDAPDNAALAIQLGGLYDTDGKKDLARRNYETALKLDPSNAYALNNLAYLIVEGNGDLDLALTYASRAKAKLPNHPEINDTLGWIYIKKNLTDNALETYRILVGQVPENPTFHYHYAMALMQKGDREGAKKQCDAALSDKPSKQEQGEIQQMLTKLS